MTQIEFAEPAPPEPEFVIRKARTRPVEVQAAKVTTDNLAHVVDWITSANHAAVLGDGQLIVQTLDGPFTVRPGDVVIRDALGGFSRAGAEEYAEFYDEVSD
jgi:hypothetical protein